MATWVITDFLGNSTTLIAPTYQDALDAASEDPHRQRLYGDPPNWSLRSSDGDDYPIEEQYDRQQDKYDYFTQRG